MVEVKEPFPQHTSQAELKSVNIGFLLNSFKYSQGDTATQNYIFEFARRNNFISVQDYSALAEKATKAAKHMFETSLKQGHTTEFVDETESFIRNEVVNLRKVLEREKYDSFDTNGIKGSHLHEMDDSTLILLLAQNILKQELKFLVATPQGRPNRRDSHEDATKNITPYSDAFFSYIVTYALEGKATGSQVFDQLFKQVGDLYKKTLSGQENSTLLGGLTDVIKKYNDTHPNHQYQLTSS